MDFIVHLFLLSGAYKLGFAIIDVMWCHHACFWINQEKPSIILKCGQEEKMHLSQTKCK
jgi:hypothetical protein